MTDEVNYSAKHWATKAQKAAESIPSVNDSTITIKQGGVTKGSFTLNQSNSETVELDAGSGGGIPDPTGHSGEFLSNDGTDLSWASVSIPTVNNATLTIQENGTNVATFTANSATNATANITVPTQASDIGAQEALVSGTNIKTINNTTILGSGNIDIDSLPSQTGNTGKFLTTNGTTASWGVPKTFNLFDFKWTDYELGDQSWLRADTFSWQDGTVYSNAYNHLVDDIDGKTATSETVGSYTISYYLADDGHKITTDEATVSDIYDETGVAWYYILDTTNQRFKLPRTKYGFVGLRDTVGKYVPESLPNITGEHPDIAIRTANGTGTGVFLDTEYANSAATGGSSRGIKVLKFDASDSSSVYQDNAPVQQRATQMYLYFYVGQFTQTATEQTAGLNSELFNGKGDLNAQNLSTQGKSLISGLGMPSGTYDDLTLLASGNTYTAPATGWFVISKVSGASGKYIDLSCGNLSIQSHSSGSGDYLVLYIPAKKGDVATVSYNVTGSTNYFRFVYAEGDVNV